MFGIIIGFTSESFFWLWSWEKTVLTKPFEVQDSPWRLSDYAGNLNLSKDLLKSSIYNKQKIHNKNDNDTTTINRGFSKTFKIATPAHHLVPPLLCDIKHVSVSNCSKIALYVIYWLQIICIRWSQYLCISKMTRSVWSTRYILSHTLFSLIILINIQATKLVRHQSIKQNWYNKMKNGDFIFTINHF